MSILLSQMFYRSRVESGKWLTRLKNLEMKLPDFAVIAENALGTYNQYRPYTELKVRERVETTGRIVFQETEAQKGIPEQVNSVTPSLSEALVAGISSALGFSQLNRLASNRRIHWQYQKPTLILDWVGDVDMRVTFVRRWLDLAKIQSSLPGVANAGNGTLTGVTAKSGVKPQTFTLKCVTASPDGGVFSVVGSDTAYGFPRATVGVPYTSDISFLLNDGAVDFAVDDTFSIVVVADPLGEKELLFFDLQKDELLIKLITASLLQSLGASRRSFRQEDLPVTDDGESMAADGISMESTTMENLASHSLFHLALRL